MNIGIVTTWFERGAAMVSKQFEDVLSKEHNVFIYARGGESYAENDKIWDAENVTWGRKRKTPFSSTTIHKKDFVKWLVNNRINQVIFNEQSWLTPLLWCDELNISTIAYVDYYKKSTIKLFDGYTALICNTKRHHSAFEMHSNSNYIPWGTDINKFEPISNSFNLVCADKITYFHSAGHAPIRKGTDILLEAALKLKNPYKLVIHSQIDIEKIFPHLSSGIKKLKREGKLTIINKTISSPGLYYLGDVYVYPSRLDGIGLTVAEAQSCGLVPIVSDNAPMNEFVTKDIGFTIDIKRYYSRDDGYYWPECLPSTLHLTNIMDNMYLEKNEIILKKKLNREYAIKNLNWEKNSKFLNELVKDIKYKKLTDKIKFDISEFENNGIKKFNNIFLNNYIILSFILRIFNWFKTKNI